MSAINKRNDKLVREVMIPRPDIIAAEEAQSISAVVDLVLEHGFTRIPVYRESMDHIVGIANAKDLLRALHQGQAEVPLRALCRPPYFIPETKKVDDLLREFQQQRSQIAMVVDEYGGTAGLVSLEDLIEEIVGEIHDEYDVEMPLVEQVGDHDWRLDARVSLDDVNELLHTRWEGEDVETLGGFVLDRLGRIPGIGDQMTVDNTVITVLSKQGRRLKQLRVCQGGDPATPVPPDATGTVDPAPPAASQPVPAGTTGRQSDPSGSQEKIL